MCRLYHWVNIMWFLFVFPLLLLAFLSLSLCQCWSFFSAHSIGLYINIVPLSNRCWKFVINSCNRARTTLYFYGSILYIQFSHFYCCFIFFYSKENKNKFYIFNLIVNLIAIFYFCILFLSFHMHTHTHIIEHVYSTIFMWNWQILKLPIGKYDA